MPIIGMTDRGASFPRIGELRKGAAKPAQGNAPGRDLDHFRFTSLNTDVMSQFRNVYGNEPQEVHCFLPYATTDENFEAWIEEWGAGSLKWRGDGQNLAIWQKPDGTYSQEPKPQPSKGGKQVGRLKVILPALGRLAYVVALTTSVNDIVELHSNLTAYQALRGDLRGIPFILSRVPRMISTPGKDARVRREKWLLHIEAAPEWVQAQLSVMERQALPGGDSVMMLPPGDVAPDDDDETIIDVMPEPTRQPATNGHTNGNGHKPVPVVQTTVAPEELFPEAASPEGIAVWRERLAKNPRPTVSTVCSTAVGTKMYAGEVHAFNAFKLAFPDMEHNSSARLTPADALVIFDKLVARKMEPQSDGRDDDWQDGHPLDHGDK